MATEGYQLLATGPQKYIDMAIAAAASIRVVDHRPIQLLTDRGGEGLPPGLFTIVTHFDGSGLPGPAAKLAIDQGAVFDRTMYIDTDCILFDDNIEHWWEACRRHPVTMHGTRKTSGEWYKSEIADWCRKFRVPFILKTNTGVMYY